ncbi:MAG: peptidase [Verrucomicrobia bacterium]|jgi:uncharacterized protein|nr:peptidase [Verrucomicrobiota bacterium]
MVSFAILFFFAVTGITLNHPDWFFDESQSIAEYSGEFEIGWLGQVDATEENNTVEELKIVEHLRSTHAIKGALKEFITDEFQCVVSFKGPGYTADAFIDRETGEYTMEESQLGFVPVINDLHKGRDTGPIWSLVIDGSAILMVLVSLTGTLLILFLKRYRKSGLIILSVGAVLSYLIYVIWVP